MKEIVVYETNGKRFDKKQDAVSYEMLCKKVNGIMSQLLPRTKEIEDGLDYNKHNLDILHGCFRALCKISSFYIQEHKKLFDDMACGLIEITDVQKVVNASNYTILKEAFDRFSCINFEFGYEFNCSYYSKNVREGFISITSKKMAVKLNNNNEKKIK